ncbi:MAG: TlpA family protein disulfide reductase [Bacteroidales bacterium]|nr:TlpA family protein disulfide reductase [Bacteroidales bacterium]
MKKFMMAMAALLFAVMAYAQKVVTTVDVVNAKGETVSVASLLPKGKPVVLSFWDTSCKPCLQEMGAISDCYFDWQDEFDFEVVAVSTDDSRNSSKAVPLAKGRGWPFVIALDKNGDFKRAMNVQSNPTMFILDKTGKIVYTHIGYTPGDEQAVYETLKKL